MMNYCARHIVVVRVLWFLFVVSRERGMVGIFFKTGLLGWFNVYQDVDAQRFHLNVQSLVL